MLQENPKATQKTYICKNKTANIPFPDPLNPDFTFIDLFAGVGGFRIALQALNGLCVYSSENDNMAQETYAANFGSKPYGDITKTSVLNEIPDNFDILCAGFPCQAFSIAGHRKGFSETRGTLFFEIAKIARKHKPKVLFLENVKNIVSHDKGRTFKTILATLDELGYKVFYEVLNSATHSNIPQNRERTFIIAFRTDLFGEKINFSFPDPIELKTSIHDFLLKEKQDEIYYYNEDQRYYPKLVEEMTSRDTFYQWRRVYVRENKNNLCPTLTANMGTGGHNVPLFIDDFGIRKLTPQECFAFQGFPMDKFILPEIANCHLYKQAGNSVTIPLIKRIAKKILECLI